MRFLTFFLLEKLGRQILELRIKIHSILIKHVMLNLSADRQACFSIFNIKTPKQVQGDATKEFNKPSYLDQSPFAKLPNHLLG